MPILPQHVDESADTTNAPRCFIFEPVKSVLPGMENLRHYGTIVHLFESSKARPHISEMKALQDAITTQLNKHEYNEKTDFICLLGSTVLVAAMAAICANYSVTGLFKAIIILNGDINVVELG